MVVFCGWSLSSNCFSWEISHDWAIFLRIPDSHRLFLYIFVILSFFFPLKIADSQLNGFFSENKIPMSFNFDGQLFSPGKPPGTSYSPYYSHGVFKRKFPTVKYFYFIYVFGPRMLETQMQPSLLRHCMTSSLDYHSPLKLFFHKKGWYSLLKLWLNYKFSSPSYGR